MNLQIKSVALATPTCQKAKDLYHHAFPKNERFPFWQLVLHGFNRNIDFFAYYDVGTFCGLSYAIHNEKMVFILYFATAESIRGKGYGSAMLSALRTHYGPKPLILNIEPVEATAPNYVERAKRLSFYKKNHFHPTGYALKDARMTYDILSTSANFQPEDLKSLTRKTGKWLPSATISKR